MIGPISTNMVAVNGEESIPITFPANFEDLGINSDGHIEQVVSLTTLPTIPTGWLTAGGIHASAIQAIADGYLDRVDAIETNLTPRESQRLVVSAAAGKLSRSGTNTIVIRNTADTKDRITANVDSRGNRLTFVYDLTD